MHVMLMLEIVHVKHSAVITFICTKTMILIIEKVKESKGF